MTKKRHVMFDVSVSPWLCEKIRGILYLVTQKRNYIFKISDSGWWQYISWTFFLVSINCANQIPFEDTNWFWCSFPPKHIFKDIRPTRVKLTFDLVKTSKVSDGIKCRESTDPVFNLVLSTIEKDGWPIVHSYWCNQTVPLFWETFYKFVMGKIKPRFGLNLSDQGTKRLGERKHEVRSCVSQLQNSFTRNFFYK